jgi:hypothetical protein
MERNVRLIADTAVVSLADMIWSEEREVTCDY